MKGQISITEKTRGERKVPGTSKEKEGSVSVGSAQTCGPEVAGTLGLESKARRRPSATAVPPAPHHKQA